MPAKPILEPPLSDKTRVSAEEIARTIIESFREILSPKEESSPKTPPAVLEMRYIHALLDIRYKERIITPLIDKEILRFAQNRYGIDFNQIEKPILIISILNYLERKGVFAEKPQKPDFKGSLQPRVVPRVLGSLNEADQKLLLALAEIGKRLGVDKSKNSYVLESLKMIWMKSKDVTIADENKWINNMANVLLTLSDIVKENHALFNDESQNIVKDFILKLSMSPNILDNKAMMSVVMGGIKAHGFKGVGDFICALDLVPKVLANKAMMSVAMEEGIKAHGFERAAKFIMDLWQCSDVLANEAMMPVVVEVMENIKAHGFGGAANFIGLLSHEPEILANKAMMSIIMEGIKAHGFVGAGGFMQQLWRDSNVLLANEAMMPVVLDVMENIKAHGFGGAVNFIGLLSHEPEILANKAMMSVFMEDIKAHGFKGAANFIEELRPEILANKAMMSVVMEGIKAHGFEGAGDFINALNVARKVFANEAMLSVVLEVMEGIKVHGFEGAGNFIRTLSKAPKVFANKAMISVVMGGIKLHGFKDADVFVSTLCKVSKLLDSKALSKIVEDIIITPILKKSGFRAAIAELKRYNNANDVEYGLTDFFAQSGLAVPQGTLPEQMMNQNKPSKSNK